MSGFGYLIPSKEKEDYLGVLFTSSIFKNRAPENHTLITVFVGGSEIQMASLSESDMISKLYPKIQSCLQIKAIRSLAILATGNLPFHNTQWTTIR